MEELMDYKEINLIQDILYYKYKKVIALNQGGS
jgi:hypothetical protein